ncbi:MAG: alpha-amylase family glycosyl hydrolase [Polyangiaceae bacterium]
MKRALPWLSCLAIAVAQGACAADEEAPPVRDCSVRVWHRPASAQASVEIVGEWDGFRRPGTTPTPRTDGWRAALFDVPPGEYRYAVIEDGVWLADRERATTATYEGREVSWVEVPDCGGPSMTVDAVDSAVDGTATVRATFFAGRADPSAVDPASVQATWRDGAPAVAQVDPRTGQIRVEAGGLRRGKHTLTLRAKDVRGREAEPVFATVWIEAERFEPRDAIIYQVVVDRYRGADGPLAPPRTPSARAGGRLVGVTRALESGEITALGANTIWLSPLYKNPEGEFAGKDGRLYSSYHGYWPVDPQAIDERFATPDELDAFVRAAHDRGVRVLFDVVPNHVHDQHTYLREHPEWFERRSCVCGVGSCDWATYIKDCWFAPYLPDLDWQDPAIARRVTQDLRWWMDRWDGDGLRIDAVPMVPRSATRRILADVRARHAHPGSSPFVIGENFTGPGGYSLLRYDLGPHGLDGSFHFPLMWTLREVVAAEQKGLAEVEQSFRAGEAEWKDSGATMGLMIGNHDVARFSSTSAGQDGGDAWEPAPQPVSELVYAKQRLALGYVLTMPGASVVYYGDEVGLAGRGDPDCRRVMPGDAELSAAQLATREFTRKVGTARACVHALRRGGLRTLAAGPEHLVYAREMTDAKDAADAPALVVTARRPRGPIDVPLAGLPQGEWVEVISGRRVTLSGETARFEPGAFSAEVWLPVASPCAPR